MYDMCKASLNVPRLITRYHCEAASLDGVLGEGDTEMLRLGHLVVVDLDQPEDGFLNAGQLHQGHFAIVGEKLEPCYGESLVLEGLLEFLLIRPIGNVGQMERV